MAHQLLSGADVATGLQLSAILMQAQAQVDVAQTALQLWTENLRIRYEAPETDGWRLNRWTDGFVREGNHGTENDQ